MSQIEKIARTKTVDNSQKEIHFIKQIQDKKVIDQTNELIEEIEGATKTICIASTSNLDQKIKESILNAIKNRIRVYVLFDDFKKGASTIPWFDEHFPALCRSNKSLKNNFIIIDNKTAFLFINPLNKLQDNPCILLKDEKCNDLFYWFCYYFWNTENNEKERLFKKVDSCKPAPYSVSADRREHINLESTLNEPFVAKVFFYPCNTNFKKEMENNSNGENFVSRDLTIAISKNETLWKVGEFFLDTNNFKGPQDIWKDDRNSLRNLPEQFIDYDSNDWNIIEKQETKEKIISQPITALSIEDMDNTEPLESSPDPYAEKTIFKYEVLPPSKPKDAKLADIYKQFEDASKNIAEKFKRLKRALDDLSGKDEVKKDAGLSHFIKEIQNKIAQDEPQDIRTMRYSDLQDFIQKWNLDENGFYVKDLIELRKKAKEEKYNIEKQNRIESFRREIRNLETEIDEIQSKIDKLAKEKTAIETRIKDNNAKIAPPNEQGEKTLENKEMDIETIKKEISNDSKLLKSIDSDISSKQNSIQKKNNILSGRKKDLENEENKKFNVPTIDDQMKDIKRDFSPVIKEPDFILPEVGELFETKHTFFLEITDTEDLAQANELKKRYTSKEYKVVAKV